MMRFTPAAIAVALVIPGAAAANPIVDAGQALSEAVTAGDATAVKQLFAAKVVVEGVAFTDAKCDKAFGKYRSHTVKGKQQAKLAACLIHAPWAPKGTPYFADRTASYELADGTLEVRFVSADSPRIEHIVVLSLGDSADAGDPNGMPGGVGVAPPPPPPPPPPPSPSVVAPSLIEPLRLTGDKNIVPDATTKAAMVKSGKDKVVASFKMCLDTSGKVDTVKQLKSSSFGVYDNELAAGIRTWTYRPYEVNGKIVPVCTAVTFIYAIQ